MVLAASRPTACSTSARYAAAIGAFRPAMPGPSSARLSDCRIGKSGLPNGGTERPLPVTSPFASNIPMSRRRISGTALGFKEGSSQNAKGRRQKTVIRRQKAEVRSQKAEDRRQKAKGKRQKAGPPTRVPSGYLRANFSFNFYPSSFTLQPSSFDLLNCPRPLT